MSQRKLENQFFEIIQLIQKARYKAYASINVEFINLCWQIGEYISRKIESNEWGRNIIQNLALYIQKKEPSIRGFSASSLWRMKQFYKTYEGNEKLATVLRELSWSSHLLILAKTKTIEEKEFYLRLAIKEKFSVRELKRQIESGFYERYMLSSQIVSPLLTQLYNTTKTPKTKEKLSPLVRESAKKKMTTLQPQIPVAATDITAVFKDKYVLDFLDLPANHSEKDLQKAIVAHLKDFILELGKDFTFVGEEYRIQVGNNDFFIDLLFFHRDLRCLVVFELKIDDFKPEYLGQLNFYLEALDRNLKKPHENPSVGVILCKSKDNEVVQYALSRNLSPAMIAEYETKLIDKKLLEKKLHEFFELSQTDND